MNIKLKKQYIQVAAPMFVRIIGKLSIGSNGAKALAIFPFIFVQSHDLTPPWLINHERIHLRQQIETLFIGTCILTFLERLYAKIVLKKNKRERYVYAATEQEAYLHMHEEKYLENRPHWNFVYYIFHKRNFSLKGFGIISFDT